MREKYEFRPVPASVSSPVNPVVAAKPWLSKVGTPKSLYDTTSVTRPAVEVWATVDPNRSCNNHVGAAEVSLTVRDWMAT